MGWVDPYKHSNGERATDGMGSHPPTQVAYDVLRVLSNNGGTLRMEPFLSGFLQGSSYWGRPVDVLLMGDHSVLVSDDLNGAIYRVTADR